MQIASTKAQPTLRYDVMTPEQGPRRLTVFTGTVDVVPPEAGRRFRVLASDPNGVRLSFYVADPVALPMVDATVVAEAWVARMPISTGADDTLRYGIVEVVGSLIGDDDRPGFGWPAVQGLLFGGDLTMTIAYRVTVMTSP